MMDDGHYIVPPACWQHFFLCTCYRIRLIPNILWPLACRSPPHMQDILQQITVWLNNRGTVGQDQNIQVGGGGWQGQTVLSSAGLLVLSAAL